MCYIPTCIHVVVGVVAIEVLSNLLDEKIRENERLRLRLTTMTEEKEALQQERDVLQQERDDLQQQIRDYQKREESV